MVRLCTLCFLSKNQFVSTVSHELRTPLTSISGSLGLIAGGALGEIPERIGGRAIATKVAAVVQKASVTPDELEARVVGLLKGRSDEAGKRSL